VIERDREDFWVEENEELMVSSDVFVDRPFLSSS
jgi:post-segregation antitoxin (ccd killing protein)